VRVLANARVWSDFSPVAATMVSSWRPDLRAQGVVLATLTATSGKGATGEVGAIGLGLAALLACVLLSCKLPRRVVFTGLLLMGSMLFAGLADLREAVALLAGHAVRGVPDLSLRGIEAAVAIAIIMLVLPARRMRQLRWVQRWNAALAPLVVLALVLLLLDLLLDIYLGAAASGTLLTVAGVTFLLAAFLWDVALSGDLTNHDGRRVRRPARVLLYMAYMLAASAAVLYFGSAHELGPWAVHGYFFDPDTETALSVEIVGGSYAVIICVGRLISTRANEEPATDSPAPAVVAQSAGSVDLAGWVEGDGSYPVGSGEGVGR